MQSSNYSCADLHEVVQPVNAMHAADRRVRDSAMENVTSFRNTKIQNYSKLFYDAQT